MSATHDIVRDLLIESDPEYVPSSDRFPVEFSSTPIEATGGADVYYDDFTQALDALVRARKTTSSAKATVIIGGMDVDESKNTAAHDSVLRYSEADSIDAHTTDESDDEYVILNIHSGIGAIDETEKEITTAQGATFEVAEQGEYAGGSRPAVLTDEIIQVEPISDSSSQAKQIDPKESHFVLTDAVEDNIPVPQLAR